MTEPRKTAKAGAAPVIPLFEFPQFDLPKFDLPKFDLPKFDLPKFDLPKFELPNVELPAELRAIAEQGIAQVKAAYERAKAAAEQATGVLEHSYAAASEGAAEYNRQVVDAARANVNAGFDYAIALLGRLPSRPRCSERWCRNWQPRPRSRSRPASPRLSRTPRDT